MLSYYAGHPVSGGTAGWMSRRLFTNHNWILSKWKHSLVVFSKRQWKGGRDRRSNRVKEDGGREAEGEWEGDRENKYEQSGGRPVDVQLIGSQMSMKVQDKRAETRALSPSRKPGPEWPRAVALLCA